MIIKLLDFLRNKNKDISMYFPLFIFYKNLRASTFLDDILGLSFSLTYPKSIFLWKLSTTPFEFYEADFIRMWQLRLSEN